jgi:hypothetical protein
VTGDHAIAGDNLILHPEIAAPVRDQLVDFFEGVGIEQQVDPLTRRQLTGRVLPLDASLAAAELCAAFQISESLFGVYAFTAWAFSQSFKNFSSPILVNG